MTALTRRALASGALAVVVTAPVLPAAASETPDAKVKRLIAELEASMQELYGAETIKFEWNLENVEPERTVRPSVFIIAKT